MACSKTSEPVLNSSGDGLEESLNVLIEDELDGGKILLIGNPQINFIAGYEKPDFAESLTFFAENDRYGIVMGDELGNYYDLTGKIVSGPNLGEELERIDGMMAYWFAIAAFYPEVEIYGSSALGTGTVPEALNSDWLVSSDFIFTGAGMDAIPAIEEPTFSDLQSSVHDVDVSLDIADDELCILVNIGNEYRAYPHNVLDWHEIVNDVVGGEAISIVYCPLTGSASIWSRVINGELTTFGVSGLLYNNNIIPYDRKTNSRWSQVYNQSVSGSLKGEAITSFGYIQAPWSELKKLNVSIALLSKETGYSRDYNEYPYGDYRENNDFILFPSSHVEERIANKEQTFLAIKNGSVKAYPLSVFSE